MHNKQRQLRTNGSRELFAYCMGQQQNCLLPSFPREIAPSPLRNKRTFSSLLRNSGFRMHTALKHAQFPTFHLLEHENSFLTGKLEVCCEAEEKYTVFFEGLH